MPYNLLTWAESTQNSGYAGVAGVGPTGVGFSISGDTITLIDKATPLLYRYGGHSITKPQAVRLNFTNTGMATYGQAAVKFWPGGFHPDVHAPVILSPGDVITGYASNTNVAEDTIIAAEISYSRIAPWSMAQFAGKQIRRELFTLTAGAAVTYNSGKATVHAAATNPTNWWRSGAIYWILGSFGVIGADGGVVHITNLPMDNWGKHVPGLIVNPLDTVLFSTQQPDFYALEPIGPIKGSDLKNTVELGFTATATNATTFGLILATDEVPKP